MLWPWVTINVNRGPIYFQPVYVELFTCCVIYNNFTCFFYCTPVVLDLCHAILRKYPSNTKCNPLLSDIIDNLIAEFDGEVEKDVAKPSTTDDGIPLASLNADNFKLPSPGCALQPDVVSIQLNDDDFTSDGDGHQLKTNDNACVGDTINNSKESKENSDDRRPGVMIVKMAMHQMMGPTSQ